MTILTVVVSFIVSCRRMSSDSQLSHRTILRRGVHLEGGDEYYWGEDVTGDGTLLTSSAGRRLSMCCSTTSTLVRHQQPLLRK